MLVIQGSKIPAKGTTAEAVRINRSVASVVHALAVNGILEVSKDIR